MELPNSFASFEANLPDLKPKGLECVKLLDGLAPGAFNYAVYCQTGLELQRWQGAEEFSRELNSRRSGTVTGRSRSEGA